MIEKYVEAFKQLSKDFAEQCFYNVHVNIFLNGCCKFPLPSYLHPKMFPVPLKKNLTHENIVIKVYCSDMKQNFC
jgi:hypothetical protein